MKNLIKFIKEQIIKLLDYIKDKYLKDNDEK